MERPLQGLRVLDFSRLVPGPYCALLLSDLGAEVIKVEDTGMGDLLRSMPPFVDGVGAIFAALNRGKKSVALQLKTVEGQEAARRLAAGCDVVVEGFRPGVTERLGIDFARLSAVNRRLVYCSISGYGQEGPRRDLPDHDLGYAATSGLLDALFPGAPRVPGVQLVDSAAALLAAIRILAALRAAEHGPQYLDISLYDAAKAMMPVNIAATAAGDHSESLLDVLYGSPRYDLYACSDGIWVAVCPLEEPFWQRLLELLRAGGWVGKDEQPDSERLRAIFSRGTSKEWCARLTAAGVPCSIVRGLKEVAKDLILRTADVPAHGEHTSVVLEAAGFTCAEIEELRRAGAIKL